MYIVVIVVRHVKKRRQDGKLSIMHVRRVVQQIRRAGKPVDNLCIVWGFQSSLPFELIQEVGVPAEDV